MYNNQLIKEENIVLNESYVKGYYSSELSIYAIVWDGVFNDDEYIALFTNLINFAAKQKVKGVFSDVRMQGKVSPYARDYLKKHLSPQGDELIDKVAVLKDTSPFKLFYLNTLIKFVGHRAKLFSNAEEAMSYLLQS